MLENPTQAVSDLSYFDCIDRVMENSKVIKITEKTTGNIKNI